MNGTVTSQTAFDSLSAIWVAYARFFGTTGTGPGHGYNGDGSGFFFGGEVPLSGQWDFNVTIQIRAWYKWRWRLHQLRASPHGWPQRGSFESTAIVRCASAGTSCKLGRLAAFHSWDSRAVNVCSGRTWGRGVVFLPPPSQVIWFTTPLPLKQPYQNDNRRRCVAACGTRLHPGYICELEL